MTVDSPNDRKSIRRTVIILTVIALVVYGGFILMGVLRA
jgi:predicted secreted protein